MAAARRQSQLSRRLPLEHSARNSMNRRNLICRKLINRVSTSPKKMLSKPLMAAVFLFLSAAVAIPASATDAPRSFSLSTTRTFAPGESVKIQLIAHNVPELEFRVYRVRDAEKFFAGLKDSHSFGEQNYAPAEQIDQTTFIERLHDFKAHLWFLIRHFFRGQFTDDARDNFREQQGRLGKRSQVVGAAQFAQIPLLNPSQLVARWKLHTPPALVCDTQQLPIDGLGAGVYLIEATDGTYKAYTVAIVTSMAVVERTEGGRADLFVADRKSGAPVANADVVLWANGQLQASGRTGSDGMSSLTMTIRGGAQGAKPENIWILARNGADAALVTPWGYNFQDSGTQTERSYLYTDRPVYRPGDSVHIKGIVRQDQNDTLALPGPQTVTLTVRGPDNKEVLRKQLTLSAHGTAAADLSLGSDAALGFYYVEFSEQNISGEGSFYVEDYKKPEYQVTVKPAVTRVLQANSIQATISARYFFGEPVAGGKVKYVVHTSTHYWWDQDEGDDNSAGADSNDSDDTGDADDTYDQT